MQEGHIRQMTPTYVICRGDWCSICSRRCPVAAKEKFIKVVQEKGGIIIGEYKTVDSKIEVKCDKNHTWYPTAYGICNKNNWCPVCAGKCPIVAKEKFINIVNSKRGTVIGDYMGSDIKIEIKCDKNHIWSVKPTHITTSDSWCPSCSNVMYSKKQINWLNCISAKCDIKIQHALSPEGEYRINLPNTRYKLDGFAIINGKKYAFEFDGCFWHGCDDCFNSEEINSVAKKTFAELKIKTRKKKSNIENAGYIIIDIKECNYDEIFRNDALLCKYWELLNNIFIPKI